MLDLYLTIFADVRSPERTEALGRLIEILLDNDYRDDLTKIEDFIALANNQVDTALQLESFICDCTYTLLNKMGITITKENINKSPALVADIIDCIITEVDCWEDYDTMLQILQHEQNDVEAIGCLVGYIKHYFAHSYIEMIDSVRPDTVTVLTSILTSRASADLDAVKQIDQLLVANLVLFINSFPDSPVITYLKDYGYLESATEIADKLTIPTVGNFQRDYATSIVGILVTHYHTYEDAYEKLEEMTDYILGDITEVNRAQLLIATSNMLANLYKGASDLNE